MKKAIRYLRFSSDDQSQHSIERQELVTATWLSSMSVLLTDTFEDKGYSARTFDRPDVKQLFEFIKKNYRNIDYLVVSELTRFSRDTGDAINMVKKIQTTYGVRIVSAGRNQVYDIYDPNSFLMMGLEFLLGNTENIKRASDINGGIYAAKAVKGKWIRGGPAPFGYNKAGAVSNRHLIINESQAVVVRFIYDAYLRNVPIYIIRDDAKKMGLRKTGSNAIHDILKNPLYMSHQYVKPWKDQPGGIFPIKDLPEIIDQFTWYRVREKISGPKYKRTIVDDLPLRGTLRCHCKNRLTGAPSINKMGKPYLYYKCQRPKHLNLSARKAHDQLQEILQLLSLPAELIEVIREETDILFKEKLQENKKNLQACRIALDKIEKDIHSVERKFISEGSISLETYHRWHQELTEKRIGVTASIEKFSRNEEQSRWIISQQLEKLTDLQYLYNDIATPDKQELLRQVFDDSLYYQEKVYRTPFIMEVFSHNLLILKDKQLLILDKPDYPNGDNPVKWRRRESNSCPNIFIESFLHAYSVLGFREQTGNKQPTCSLAE